MRVLIVDDDEVKRTDVRSVLDEALGILPASIHSIDNYIDACEYLEREQVDLLILDLLLPRDPGAEPELNWGIEIARLLCDANRRLRQPRYVVGLSAFTNTNPDVVAAFQQEGWDLLQYSAASDEWRARLSRIVSHNIAAILASEAEEACYQTDLAVITALTHCEHEALLALPLSLEKTLVRGDEDVYYTGTYTSGADSRKLITASAVQMGMPASTALAMKVMCRFKPRFVAMCGIAAGVKGNFGDILIADQTYDYGSGKSIAGVFGTQFEPAPDPIPIDPFLGRRLAEFRTNQSMLNEIREGWRDRVSTPLQAHFGPLASGAAVLQNRWQINAIKRGQRKLIGIEMEAYGLFMAARLAPFPKPKVFVAKSICDFGDRRKSDDFQSYAAYTSAQFVYRFACNYL